jgi:serine/threonine protein kinase
LGLSSELQIQDQKNLQTLPFHLIGTPSYMSPEQASAQKALISYQSDIWSFGMILYEILVGNLPWGRNVNYFQMIANLKHFEVPIDQFDALNLTSIKDILVKCLNRDISKRFENAMVLRDAFLIAIKKEKAIRTSLAIVETRKILKNHQIFEKYFKSALLAGDAFSLKPIIQMIHTHRVNENIDWQEIYRCFEIAKQVIDQMYSWKDQYVESLKTSTEQEQKLLMEKDLFKQAISISFKEKMNLIPIEELHLQLEELQKWQMDQIREMEEQTQAKILTRRQELKIWQDQFNLMIEKMTLAIWKGVQIENIETDPSGKSGHQVQSQDDLKGKILNMKDWIKNQWKSF